MNIRCHLRRGWWRLCALLLIACACAVEAAPTSPLRFRGLRTLIASDLSIVSLLQDRQGFIWIGTHNTGLYRYDGYQAVRYANHPFQPSSLPNDRVSTLFEDRDGRLWAGTQSGLARYNPAANDFTLFVPASGPNNHRLIKQIVSDGDGGMWIATWGGLQHFDPASGRFEQYTHQDQVADSLASNDLNALALDQRGGLWIATWPGGIDYLAKGARSFRHYRIDAADAPDPKLNLVRALFYDKLHRLWIGTERGAYRWNDGSAWDTRRHLPSPPSRINGFYRDRSGATWAGTLQAGLLRWDDRDDASVNYVHRADDQYSLPSADIRAVMQDRGGQLWVASFNAGISTVNLSSSGFARSLPFAPTPQDPQPNNALQTIAGSPDGRLWIGGNSGFALFDPATGEVLKTYRADPARKEGGLGANTVYSLYQAPEGPLWIGTSAGLHRLDKPDGPFQVMHLGSAAEDFINTVVPGRGGVLWLGTGRNVVRYDTATGQTQVFAHRDKDPASLSLTGATCILEDRLGRVWIGSEWSNGLEMLDTRSGTLTHFLHDQARPDSLSDDKIGAFHEDAQGRIWIGTSSGLNEVLTGADGAIRFRRYTGQDSVGPVKIMSVRSDKAGKIWLGTVAGLVALTPASGAVERYTVSDGLSDGLTVGVSYAAPDGTLYFGGVQGMTVVHPEAVRSSSHRPQVAITDISVASHSLNQGARPDGVLLDGAVSAPRSLTLPARESVFSIEFSGLYFNEPAQNRYQYRLAGFDRAWVSTDAAHRNASYTNLDPGVYTFEVRAANDHGIWSEQTASFTIRILPPFWKTWWFRLLSFALCVSALAIFYRMRVRTLKLTQARLERLVLERTRELKDSNDKLATLSTTDGLTDITNRRGFDAAFGSEWARALRGRTPVSIAMIDVDHFKLYNDHYGHQAGDNCLREVARVIARHARRVYDLAARYGGAEFVLLMPACEGPQALKLAQGICADLFSLAMPHADSPQRFVSVSIGVASMVPGPHCTAAELLEMADQALYFAKHNGRNHAHLHTDPVSVPA